MPKPRLIKPLSKILDESIDKLSNIPDYFIEDEEDERERLQELEDGEVQNTFEKFEEFNKRMNKP